MTISAVRGTFSHWWFTFTSILLQSTQWRTRLHFLLTVSRQARWRTVRAAGLRSWHSSKDYVFFFAQARRCLTFTEPDSWFSVLQHGVQSAHTTCTHLQCSAHVCSAWVHDSGWVFYPPTSVSPSLTDPHILVPVVFWLVLKTCSVHNLLTDCYDTWGSIMTRK